MRAALVLLTMATAAVLLGSRMAEARQLGALVSPGRLSQAHASLEGIRSCDKCHEAGERVTAAKCLTCHQPIAERIRAKRGVHRAVQGDCVTCHAEHQGTSGELRPFNLATFDHARDAGYRLDGRHAPLAAKCASCHKTRSYLGVSTACSTCHQDPHKGTLGMACQTCHTTQTAFKDVRQGFDHTKAAFRLEGAHQKVACESCHKNQVFKGLPFAKCNDCHSDPHTPKMTEACATCHTPATWRTRRVDHARTSFPLVGKHQTTACASCHVRPALQVALKADTCATCHQDPHKGAFKQDCKSCHIEQGFAKAPFDHATTPFPLTGKHAPAACASCHKNLTTVATRTGRSTATAAIDFRGLKRECVTCHDDTHRGDLGQTCETCHGTERFALASYTHKTPAPFFAGAHAKGTCAGCHLVTTPMAVTGLVRAAATTTSAGATATALAAATTAPGPFASVRFTATSRTCATCHLDVHTGQFAGACETCHSIEKPAFTPASGFDHARTAFRLGGKHAQVACEKCHTTASTPAPAGAGRAVKYTGVGKTCVTCHTDIHLGQVGTACETCHSDQTFAITKYTHRNPAQRSFFVGAHATPPCASCHARESGAFPAGRGTAVRFAVGTACTSCHRDVHNGALGPRCGDCHKFDKLVRRNDDPAAATTRRPAR